MTGAERAELASLRDEFREADQVIREELAGLRSDVQPAINFYLTLQRIGRLIEETVRHSARFVKWGVGVGASLVTLLIGLRALGLW